MPTGVLLASLLLGQGSSFPPQADLRFMSPPQAFTNAGKSWVFFELAVNSSDRRAVRLREMEVVDSLGNHLATFNEGEFKAMARMGNGQEPGDKVVLPAGGNTTLFVQMPVQGRLPDGIRVNMSLRPSGSFDWDANSPLGKLLPSRNITVGNPFTGDRWVAANGPSNFSSHRRAMFFSHGECFMGQRFAIDWIQIDQLGKSWIGPEDKNDSYFCYNKKALAVADGTIVHMQDGIPENVPHRGDRAVEMTIQTAGGNQVALKFGNGLYALYGHLIPGSIKVRLGQVVKKGQELGRIGNSGNSSEAHLHFQVSDRPHFIESNGLPFRHDKFWLYDVKTDEDFHVDLRGKVPYPVANDSLLENQIARF